MGSPRLILDNDSMSSITDVAGIQAGHFTDARRPTGCTVVVCQAGAVAGVDVRGAAPGTRETDLLSPSNLVNEVHAVLLAGGSAWGLDAAAGVMRWLEEQGVGLDVRFGKVPIVPAAVLFDLYSTDAAVRPDAHAGYEACRAASSQAPGEGSVGAGAGAAIGKVFGIERAMKGGIGTASLRVGDVTVGAIVACNAVGDVVDPETGRVIAGARTADGASLADIRRALLAGEAPQSLLAGTNTTIGVVATDAPLTKAQATRLATMAHDGLARAIRPVHTMSDGDTMFALSTGRSKASPGMVVLGTMAVEVTAQAIVRAIRAATGIRTPSLHLPAASEL